MSEINGKAYYAWEVEWFRVIVISLRGLINIGGVFVMLYLDSF